MYSATHAAVPTYHTVYRLQTTTISSPNPNFEYGVHLPAECSPTTTALHSSIYLNAYECNGCFHAASLALMAPPAKRRRRNTVDSDDEVDPPRNTTNTLANYLISSPVSPNKARTPSASPSPVKTRPATRNSSANASNGLTRRPASIKNGTSPSPKKARGFSNGDEKGKSADLKTLFSKQAQRSAKSGAANVPKNPPIDDIFSDPISEEDDISEFKVSSSSLVGQHARKRQREGGQVAPSSAPSSSQRFLKPTRSTDLSSNEGRPWSERFGPRNLDELAVHKKKVSDVRRWIEDVIVGRMRQRLLILKGPAGSGKTTTVQLLAKEMDCEILGWKNPTNNTSTGFVSTSAMFEEFLGRGGKFGALEMDDASSPTSSVHIDGILPDHANRLMVVEEFPNTFSRSSSMLSSFRRTILNYLAANTPSLSRFAQHHRKEPVKPVVMIISETLLTTTSASADSFTAHRLLGPEILRHPGVGVIEFNPIAPTLLEKALELIVQKEARVSGRRRTPGPLVLKRLGEIGDVRSAISSLEFLCLKGDQDADWGSKVAFIKQKKSVKDGISLTKGETESLELISQREATLGIFHAVGKVVYNKREEATPNGSAETLPDYLSHNSRPKKSLVSVDSLIDETGTDTHTFISALHENYAPSCESTSPMDLSTPMDYLNDCIEALSESDLLCPSRDIFFGGRGAFASKDSGSHILRQDEITFNVAVRGLLFALPNPVQRKMATGARGSDAFKMFYPQSIKLWRAKEEIEGLVDMWSSKLLRGEDSTPTKNLTDGAGAFRRPQQSSEMSWMQRQQQKLQPTKAQADSGPSAEDPAAPLLSLGSAARREMLLERLPYIAHIARSARGSKSNTIRLRDLDKVVSFRGIGGPANEDDEDADGADDDNEAPAEAWATDRPNEEASPRKKTARVKSGAVESMMAQKLVLSDDDIED